LIVRVSFDSESCSVELISVTATSNKAVAITSEDEEDDEEEEEEEDDSSGIGGFYAQYDKGLY